MADALARLMTVEEFIAWQGSREELYELVEGTPVLYRDTEMMSGGSSMHDRIITNIIIALGNQLCRPATADLAVRTKNKSLRRADVLVTCDPPSLDTFESLDPRIVVEVLSPNNTGVAWHRKLDEYRRHAKLEYILRVDSRLVDVKLYSRSPEGWEETDFAPDGTVAFTKLSCALSLSVIYRGTGLTSLPSDVR
jgi:Uma2 family endonuclease